MKEREVLLVPVENQVQMEFQEQLELKAKKENLVYQDRDQRD